MFFNEYGFSHSNSVSSSVYLVNSVSGMTEKKKIAYNIPSVRFPCRMEEDLLKSLHTGKEIVYKLCKTYDKFLLQQKHLR